MFRKQLKIAKLVCECWAKKIFFKLISIDSIEKVLLDISSNSVIVFSKKEISLNTIRDEVQDLQIEELVNI
ncbi:hypothetical protein [Enterococcus casseliflavus]|uniref:hypothetical protein n=1 Tax=Enterococcus casseliflavus TaxID=37734 RepID=UPI00232D9261|nr:hypothetical protein [Enterococcus casseliflavus]MDB1688217.1 hypothetical protein [Enterococcus casseliflavus]